MQKIKNGIRDHRGLLIFIALLATLVSTLVALTYCEPFVEWAERFKQDGSYELVEITDDNKPDLVTLFPNSGLSNSAFADGYLPDYFEELTGYKVDYQQALNGQDDLVQAILASKEPYHMLKLESGTYLKNVSNNAFVDLKPALEKYGKNLYGENGVGGVIPKEAWDAVTDAETGAIYAIPETGFSGMIMSALVWNMEQLEEVGITKVPETITEVNDAFYALQAHFGENNPLYHAFAMGGAQAYIQTLAAAWELPENFYVTGNNEISHVMYHPQYVKYMSWLTQLNEAKIISPGWEGFGAANLVTLFSQENLGCGYISYWNINDIVEKMSQSKGISEEEARANLGYSLLIRGTGDYGSVKQKEAKYLSYQTIGYYCAVPVHMAKYTPWVIDWIDQRITDEAFEGFRLGKEGLHFEYSNASDKDAIEVEISGETKYVKILPAYKTDILPGSMYQCGGNPKVGKELWCLSEQTYKAWPVLIEMDSPNAIKNPLSMCPYIAGWSEIDIECRSWVLTYEQQIINGKVSQIERRISSLKKNWVDKWWTSTVDANVQAWHKGKAAKASE